MATLVQNNPTLSDLAKLRDPDGGAAQVARIMDEVNEGLHYFPFMEGNLPTGHQSTILAGIPEATWRSYYKGVSPTTGQRVQVVDNCGMLEAYGIVDKALLERAASPMAFRLEEDMDHIEGISQQLMEGLIYGNEANDPDRITGLAPRYSSLTAASGRNIVNGGMASGQSDGRSIWLVVGGNSTITGIVPKGSTAGIQVEDRGQQTISETSSDVGASGKKYEAMVTHYKVDAGLAVRNWKYAVRICNLDASVNGLASAQVAVQWKDGAFENDMANLPDLMAQATDLIPSMGRGRPFWMMTRQTKTLLRRQLSAQVRESTLTMENVGGTRVTNFDGIPIAVVDQMHTDEARIT